MAIVEQRPIYPLSKLGVFVAKKSAQHLTVTGQKRLLVWGNRVRGSVMWRNGGDSNEMKAVRFKGVGNWSGDCHYRAKTATKTHLFPLSRLGLFVAKKRILLWLVKNVCSCAAIASVGGWYTRGRGPRLGDLKLAVFRVRTWVRIQILVLKFEFRVKTPFFDLWAIFEGDRKTLPTLDRFGEGRVTPSPRYTYLWLWLIKNVCSCGW